MTHFDNIVGKEEMLITSNGGEEHFLIYPTMFSTLQKRNLIFGQIFNFPFANAYNSHNARTLMSRKGFTNYM